MQSIRIVCVAVAPLLVLSTLGTTRASAAPVPIVEFDPSKVTSNLLPEPPGEYYGFYEDHFDGLTGWSFTLNQPATITQVGVWDQGGDGLSRAFQVGLWQAQNFSSATTIAGSDDLLGAGGATIPGGTSAALNGIYRAVDLSEPLSLSPGNYDLALQDTATTTDPIEYVDGGPSNDLVTIGSPIVDGSSVAVQGLEVGPMLFNVPEPSTVAVGVALLLIAATARAKRPLPNR